MERTSKNLPLESLRGIAALVVATSHTALNSPLSTNVIVKNASWMVDFFFVLSGFVIALNYADRLNSWAELKKFQLRRFWRLYPLHFFTLLIFLGIEVIKYGFESQSGIVANNPAFSKSDLSAFVHNLFLTHSIFIGRSTFNAPSWSISTEFYTYFIFGVFTLLMTKYLVRAWFSVIVICFALLSFKLIDLSTFQPLIRCIFSFFIGAMVWFMTKRYQIKTNTLFTTLSLIVSIGAIIILANTPYKHIIPFLFGLSVLMTAQLNDNAVIKKILCLPVLVYLGTISYSVYLNHLAIWWFMNQILRFGFKVTTYSDAEGNIRMALDVLPATFLTLFGIFVIVAASHFSYKWIEHRFKQGMKAKFKAPAPTVELMEQVTT